MAIRFPNTLDDFPNPLATTLEDTAGDLGHVKQHSNANDAIEALEAAVGVINSDVTTSHEFRLNSQEAITLGAKHFGLKGDGSDETSAMTDFFNSAIAHPGVRHLLDAKTYVVTDVMPVINVSNVWIEGQGADIHDTGSRLSGTEIKYTGSSLGDPNALVWISAVDGFTNQHLSNIIFRGIGLNCNSLVFKGLFVNSVQDSFFEVAVANATGRGVEVNVTGSLGEARDSQRNTFILKLRQLESPNGGGLLLAGDSSANTSFNHFWIDAQHKNAAVLQAVNSDNNTFHYFRAYQAVGGTATESATLQGGDTSAESCRAEKFLHYSASQPIHVYGTGDGYTVASQKHYAFLDGENGTPAPIIGTGASINYVFDTTETVEEPWISYSPTITSFSGTLTSVTSVSGKYRKQGKVNQFKVEFVVTTNGTGGTALVIPLPIPAASTFGQVCYGMERGVTGKMQVGFIDGGSSDVVLKNYDGTYPGTDGGVYEVCGFYEVA